MIGPRIVKVTPTFLFSGVNAARLETNATMATVEETTQNLVSLL